SGPNTGGMGAYSPPQGFPDELIDRVREQILGPVLRGLLAEGERYVGVLYCGLMWTQSGPAVIEFNARFGDPETQVLMPRVGGDFAGFLKTVADGAMDPSLTALSANACVGVVLATADYPARSVPVRGLPPDTALAENVRAFWGGSALRDSVVDASGGRVITVTALGENLSTARDRAYEGVRALARRFGDASSSLTYRTDIANLG
ncbi:MAG: phosphoribosylamine--glycine ligase, partial [Candidatus Eremiobacteraeota bacterium]|nr:phosphoribosylamine--glycine ligase [Candidatus Eremiobacteraeota bacterium]